MDSRSAQGTERGEARRTVDLSRPAGAAAWGRVEARSRVLAGLGPCPHLVEVREVAVADGRGVVAVGDAEGGRLSAWIERNGPLDGAETVAIGRAVAAALETLNDAGVVHGAVAPGAIWLDGSGAARLDPFAGLLGDESVAHAAPECVAGAPATEAADVYGLAATLAHCLDGRPPAAGGSPVARAYLRLREAIEWGLRPDPDARPSAAAFVDHLRGLPMNEVPVADDDLAARALEPHEFGRAAPVQGSVRPFANAAVPRADGPFVTAVSVPLAVEPDRVAPPAAAAATRPPRNGRALALAAVVVAGALVALGLALGAGGERRPERGTVADAVSLRLLAAGRAADEWAEGDAGRPTTAARPTVAEVGDAAGPGEGLVVASRGRVAGAAGGPGSPAGSAAGTAPVGDDPTATDGTPPVRATAPSTTPGAPTTPATTAAAPTTAPGPASSPPPTTTPATTPSPTAAPRPTTTPAPTVPATPPPLTTAPSTVPPASTPPPIAPPAAPPVVGAIVGPERRGPHYRFTAPEADRCAVASWRVDGPTSLTLVSDPGPGGCRASAPTFDTRSLGGRTRLQPGDYTISLTVTSTRTGLSSSTSAGFTVGS